VNDVTCVRRRAPPPLTSFRCSRRNRLLTPPGPSTSSITQGPAAVARHVIGCQSTQGTRVQYALDDVAEAMDLAYIARPVMGCHLITQGTMVQNALDDVAGSM